MGDVFVTHPVLARRIIDAKYKARGNKIIVIDPKRSNTAWYANTHLMVRPGNEALLLVGLLKAILRFSGEKGQEISDKLGKVPDEAIAKATGIATGQIREAAIAFNDAEKGLVILCPGLRGIRDVNLVAWLCKLITDSAKGDKQLMPLLTFGNAVGAFRMSSKGGWKSFPRLIEEMSLGKIKLLIDFGEDLLSSYPSAQIQKGLEQLEFFAISSLFVSETENAAQLILPCASWLEKSGTVNFFDGRREVLESILAPAWAAKSALEIICGLSRELGAPLDGEKIRQEAKSRSCPIHWAVMPDKSGNYNRLSERINELITGATVEDKEYPYLLISGSATGHFADGSITGNMKWAREMFPASFIELNAEDAQGLGVKDGDEVLVSSRCGEITLPIQVSDRLSKGVASVPSYFAETRSIFDWKITAEGKLETSPERVSLRAKRGNLRK